uniref:PIN2 (TERF1) interacting telomerase inhibitor 1 n=1 Tax=Neogobius melanostomus TaxID=47308 RepID=A0A8C6WE41_9GOBI
MATSEFLAPCHIFILAYLRSAFSPAPTKDPKMSMLAEPRRKQKWSVDPRNSAWSKDDNKFGQKMLERMGWSKGKGLGRSEQGTTDHIKVKVKNNGFGLGANTSHEDKWIAHQDDFNDLLAQLNSCHGQSSNNADESEEPKGFSLEEKSKTVKKRVHYMKFTKGKDLSSRSEKDLNCIFGKRGQSSKEQEQESNSSDSEEEKEETTVKASHDLDTESITKTVTSTLSMQEYFAQRMAHLKKARGQAQSSDTSEMSGQCGESSPAHCNNSSAGQSKKKKKKGKKDQHVSEEKDFISEEQKESERVNPEQKKKKRKTYEIEQPLTPEEEIPPPKKKKNKKHKKDTEALNGIVLVIDDVQPEVNETDTHHEEECVIIIKDAGAKKKSKKDKKKKKRAKVSE